MEGFEGRNQASVDLKSRTNYSLNIHAEGGLREL